MILIDEALRSVRTVMKTVTLHAWLQWLAVSLS